MNEDNPHVCYTITLQLNSTHWCAIVCRLHLDTYTTRTHVFTYSSISSAHASPCSGTHRILSDYIIPPITHSHHSARVDTATVTGARTHARSFARTHAFTTAAESAPLLLCLRAMYQFPRKGAPHQLHLSKAIFNSIRVRSGMIVMLIVVQLCVLCVKLCGTPVIRIFCLVTVCPDCSPIVSVI